MTIPPRDPEREAFLIARIASDIAELQRITVAPGEAAKSAPSGISTAEAALRFNRSERQIRRLCERGAGERVGAGWVVDPDRLRALLDH